MVRSPEALRVNLVDILSAGGARRKPSALRHHLQPADGRTVAWRASEDGLNLLPGQLSGPDLLRRESPQNLLLLRRSRCFDAVVDGLAEFAREFAVDFAGIASHPRRNLRRQ